MLHVDILFHIPEHMKCPIFYVLPPACLFACEIKLLKTHSSLEFKGVMFEIASKNQRCVCIIFTLLLVLFGKGGLVNEPLETLKLLKRLYFIFVV